ncbi:hypothetical protein EDD86DRAFT_199559 [Gorgonomyces haynaldii]|nr:hypothetical protein EDD86DRAFT_199559 [Gorgonomyces haynaldii]
MREPRTTSPFLTPESLFKLRLLFIFILLVYFCWQFTASRLSFYTDLASVSWLAMFFYEVYAASASYNYLQSLSYKVKWTLVFDFLLVSSGTLSTLMTIVFWTGCTREIAENAEKGHIPTVIRLVYGHSLNIAISYLEIWMAKTPISFSGLVSQCMTVLLYITYLVILNKMFGVGWPYPFMHSWFSGNAWIVAAGVCLVLMLTILSFLLIFGLARLRDYMTPVGPYPSMIIAQRKEQIQSLTDIETDDEHEILGHIIQYQGSVTSLRS